VSSTSSSLIPEMRFLSVMHKRSQKQWRWLVHNLFYRDPPWLSCGKYFFFKLFSQEDKSHLGLGALVTLGLLAGGRFLQ
jgi:hypothetical protein